VETLHDTISGRSETNCNGVGENHPTSAQRLICYYALIYLPAVGDCHEL